MRKTAMTVLVCGMAMCSSLALAQEGNAKSAIDAVTKEWAAAAARGDAARIASAYTMDAVIYPPNQQNVSGRDAIQKYWASAIGTGMTIALASQEIVAHGDTAHDVGTYTISGKDGAALDRGKFIVIWKRDGGSWKMHRDIWNSDMPAAPAPTKQ